MSQFIKYAILVFLSTLMLSLCGCGESYDYSWTAFDELPEDYSLEDAKADNCVVHEDGDISFGQNIWDSFLKKTEKGEPATVRVVDYYTEENEAPKLYIKDLVFDGESYVLTDYSDPEPRISEYKYLMRFEEDASSETSTYKSVVRYILVNENTYTMKDIWSSILSSAMAGGIDFRFVYTDYNYK